MRERTPKAQWTIESERIRQSKLLAETHRQRELAYLEAQRHAAERVSSFSSMKRKEQEAREQERLHFLENLRKRGHEPETAHERAVSRLQALHSLVHTPESPNTVAATQAVPSTPQNNDSSLKLPLSPPQDVSLTPADASAPKHISVSPPGTILTSEDQSEHRSSTPDLQLHNEVSGILSRCTAL